MPHADENRRMGLHFWPTGKASRIACAVCAAALVLFAALALSSVSTKSATFDEPLTSCAAYAVRCLGDFRVSPEDPPLWMHWAGLAYRTGSLKVDLDRNTWRGMPANPGLEWRWAGETLWRTPGNDGQ